MSEKDGEKELRLRGMATSPDEWCLSEYDVDAIRYALRAIDERRELLAALKSAVELIDGIELEIEDFAVTVRRSQRGLDAVIAKCEAP